MMDLSPTLPPAEELRPIGPALKARPLRLVASTGIARPIP